MLRFVYLAAAVLTFLALPSSAYAQAAIAGLVRDSSGGVLPGVTVEASSPALIEKVRSVVTDDSGRYRIENLRPGSYVVTFTLPGFSTVKREGIELTGTFVASVNADLAVGGLEETITITGEAPTVDVQSTVRQQVMDREILDSIPMGRSDRDLHVLAPATTSTRVDVGGSATTTTGRALVHGSRGSSQRLLQNGLSVAVPFDGSGSSQNANLAAYQEVTVDTAAFDAEQETGGTRVNLIPREGGNAFTGTFFASYASEGLQGDNYSQDLQDRGLGSPNTIKSIYDVNPGLGGPIMRDKLWFFLAVRYNGSSQYPADIFFNRNENNPAVWNYDPDRTSRPAIESWWRDATTRLTWQASPRNKVGVTWRYQVSCYCPEEIEAAIAPEAGLNRNFPGQNQPAADWSSPVTNRLLLEAGVLRFRSPTLRNVIPGQNPQMIRVEDQALDLEYRGQSGEIRNRTINLTLFYRAAASYITGAHTFKAGYTGGSSDYLQEYAALPQPVTYRFNNGVPNRINMWASPTRLHVQMLQNAFYAQHRWTVNRLTLSYGLRYDHFTNAFPAVHLGPGPLVPNRDVTLPAIDTGVSWHDLTPKSGLAYDLFGNGRTAVKMTLNRYIEGQGGAQGDFGVNMSPASRLVRNTNRSWNDIDADYVPDCNLTIPQANGECGAMANAAFGSLRSGAAYDRDVTHGWNKRDFNWEFSGGIQHEFAPRTSVDVTYFRRWYGNFTVIDDRALTAADFDQYSISAPVDPRLPGGGGYLVSGLYDLKPARFGIAADNFITRSSNFGDRSEVWNGLDVVLNTRPRPGVMLQGGLSTGRTSSNNCEVRAQLPEIAATNPFCDTTTNFLTQVKFLGVYTVPRVDVQVSGAFRSESGAEVLANYVAANAEIVPSLGRNLAGAARNVTVNIVEPGTMYGERLTQLDLRVAKIFRFGGSRTSASLDIFNVFNSNAVLTQSNAFADWQSPQSILLARFIKFGVQFDF